MGVKKRGKGRPLLTSCELSKQPSTPKMNTAQRALAMQRWNIFQHELMPEWKLECGALTPKLEKLIQLPDWVRQQR